MLCDKKFPSKLKGKFYCVAIRSALLFGTECWPVKKVFEYRMKVSEMRMLRWMCGHTMMDKIRNQEFKEKFGLHLSLRRCVRTGCVGLGMCKKRLMTPSEKD